MRYEGRTFTYAELASRIDKLVSVLLGFGVREGERVALVSFNSHANIELMFACARIGAVFVGCNVRLSQVVTVQLLKESGARVVFFSREVRDRIKHELDPSDAPLIEVMLEDGDELGIECYEDLIEQAEPSSVCVRGDSGRTALMLYTSGTTGIPRCVMFSHAALERRIESDRRELGLSADDVALCVLPLYHITLMSSLMVLRQGGTLVISNSRTAQCIADLIDRYQVTFVGLVPFLLRSLVSFLEDTGRRLDTLRLLLYGGEPISAEMLERCESVLSCGFMQGYGMTETSSAITLLRPEQHRDPAHLSTVGTPVEGVDLKIVDDNDVVLPCGQAGEILVRTDMLMSGYFNDPVRTAEVMADGWYRTGDIGVMTEEGYVKLLARKSDLVISGGENIYPSEVDACIRELGKGIEDVAVLGVPDKQWGEALVAVIARAPESQITAEQVCDWCKQRLGSYKKPRRVLFVDEIKRGATGKVNKKDVMALLEASEGE